MARPDEGGRLPLADRLKSLARKYLAHGWSVVPVHVPVADGCTCGRDSCDTPGKHPRGSWSQFQLRRARPEELEDWLDSYDPLNIGVVTGKVSGLIVIDVDLPQAETRLAEVGLTPDTLTAMTGGGGRHYFYRCTERVRSKGGGLGPGIDIKAEGGFIVVAPSKHESGRRYRWLNSLPIAKFNLKVLGEQDFKDNTYRPNGWYEDLLKGVEEGSRHYSAARLAGRYASMGLTQYETRMLLAAWNSQNTPPLEGRELRATISSVYRKHSSEVPEEIRSAKDLVSSIASIARSRGW